MIKHFLFLAIAAITLSGCPMSVKDLQVYNSLEPYAGEPEVRFRSATGELPLFQFRFLKEYLHTGLPYPNELETIKTKGAAMGANFLILER